MRFPTRGSTAVRSALTGRVVDSAVVLGPLVHEFGWTGDDHDLLGLTRALAQLVQQRETARELTEQVPEFDCVVVAVGSGGTMAGLVREHAQDHRFLVSQ